MAIVKCLNPQCDFFERTVPEGDCCPYCGEPLNATTAEPQPPEYHPPLEPQYTTPEPPQNTPAGTVVEPIGNNLKLIHSNTGQTFTIDRYSAANKMYLGRQDGYGDRNMLDLSSVPFAERISRVHAYITCDRNNFAIVDDNSRNGTILNGKSLTPQQPYPLHTGDRLEFGREQKVIFTVEIG